MRGHVRAAIFALSTTLAWSGSAVARSEASTRHSLKQAYSAALRYLRVDMGFEVVEKDPDAAYLLFKYRPGRNEKESHGALELVQSGDEVMLYVTLAKFPRYREEMLSDGVLRKLRDEYGAPPAPKPPPPKKAPDEDEDDEDDGDGDNPPKQKQGEEEKKPKDD